MILEQPTTVKIVALNSFFLKAIFVSFWHPVNLNSNHFQFLEFTVNKIVKFLHILQYISRHYQQYTLKLYVHTNQKQKKIQEYFDFQFLLIYYLGMMNFLQLFILLIASQYFLRN